MATATNEVMQNVIGGILGFLSFLVICIRYYNYVKWRVYRKPSYKKHLQERRDALNDVSSNRRRS